MTTRHPNSATPRQRITNSDDGAPVKPALPQRIPGAALAELKTLDALNALAVLVGATDVRSTQRMPSRAEWEAAKAGLLTLAATTTPQPEEHGPRRTSAGGTT
jgi:hypothetical protein